MLASFWHALSSSPPADSTLATIALLRATPGRPGSLEAALFASDAVRVAEAFWGSPLPERRGCIPPAL